MIDESSFEKQNIVYIVRLQPAKSKTETMPAVELLGSTHCHTPNPRRQVMTPAIFQNLPSDSAAHLPSPPCRHAPASPFAGDPDPSATQAAWRHQPQRTNRLQASALRPVKTAFAPNSHVSARQSTV
ncbi:MAG: hypothetical protein OXI60_09365 [Acidiferrobacterales bacterium]|nr:hypothetical protein [Acidiferrobacterales bacterium]